MFPKYHSFLGSLGLLLSQKKMTEESSNSEEESAEKSQEEMKDSEIKHRSAPTAKSTVMPPMQMWEKQLPTSFNSRPRGLSVTTSSKSAIVSPIKSFWTRRKS